MIRVDIELDAHTRVTRRDGLLDVIVITGRDVEVTMTVGPSGAMAAEEAGAHLLAAARRQYIPVTTSMGATR